MKLVDIIYHIILLYIVLLHTNWKENYKDEILYGIKRILIGLPPLSLEPWKSPRGPNYRGGGGFHMLGVRGCAARQGVLFGDICSLRVYFFANFSCLCSLRYVFQSQGIQSQGFLIVLSGSGSVSLGGTTLPILVPSSPSPGSSV